MGAKELQLSIQGISISSASLADPLDGFSPLATPAPASHARLRHALSWIREKQLPSSSAGAAEAAVDLGTTLAPSDGMQLLYNTGACTAAVHMHGRKCRMTACSEQSLAFYLSALAHLNARQHNHRQHQAAAQRCSVHCCFLAETGGLILPYHAWFGALQVSAPAASPARGNPLSLFNVDRHVHQRTFRELARAVCRGLLRRRRPPSSRSPAKFAAM